MKVTKIANNAIALSNMMAVNASDFDPSVKYVLVEHAFVFTIMRDDSVQKGEIGTSLMHRRWAQLSLNQDVTVRPYDPLQQGMMTYIDKIILEVSLFQRRSSVSEEFDVSEMSKIFLSAFMGQIFTVGQSLVFDFHGHNLLVKVLDFTLVELDKLKSSSTKEVDPSTQGKGLKRGILMNESSCEFTKEAESTIRLTGNATSTTMNRLIAPNFKFEDLGIGGLDTEFSSIFRRAFASRIFPPAIVQKLGINHVKGILLHGPPGTGKTLVARQIGKMLNAREPKIVNGPEVLNKYVGQSEENIRKLFIDAEKEYKARGEESSLHIIIFDELDAIFKQRGSKNDGTGVGDTVVNQLLAKMDGVDQLNNILIIGMTNRPDLIDEALLRPGRLEVHMEIGLPDERGRFQILKIHTAKMRENNLMETDVSLEELTHLTKNFSGAEISGLIRSATSFAFNRHIEVGNLAAVSADMEKMKICRSDFMNALDEVHASFGVSETELELCVKNKIIPFSNHIERILNDGRIYIEQVRSSPKTPLISVLLHGLSGSGKTALAATIALDSEFPFIKLISPDSMVGTSEAAKISAINRVFSDSYKSPLSVIVLDNIEKLLEWVPIGPRFSNAVLQTLQVLIKKSPPNDRKLLILATTSEKHVMQQMDFGNVFDYEICVPHITDLNEMNSVLKELQVFNQNELLQVMSSLTQYIQGNKTLSIGVKKLLRLAETAAKDVDKVERFVNTVIDTSISD